MTSPGSVPLACPDCQGGEFEARVIKDEGVGAARCLQCGRDYLLLDSADYWFDVIQQRPYPRPSRCRCSGTAFRLRIDYEYRDDGEVRSVDVWRTCAACGESRRQFDAQIDYSPTARLVDRPLTYCKVPKLLYDLRELTLYAKRADVARIVRFLNEDAGCQFALSFHENRAWTVRTADGGEVEQMITKDTDPYVWIYASPQPIKISHAAVNTARKEDAFWKRREIIRISSPTHMVLGSVTAQPSLLYYIKFSNEYVEDDRVVAKPQRFRDLTTRLLEWLRAEFVTWRGPNSFDNEEEHVRAFGDRYRSKAEKKPRGKQGRPRST